MDSDRLALARNAFECDRTIDAYSGGRRICDKAWLSHISYDDTWSLEDIGGLSNIGAKTPAVKRMGLCGLFLRRIGSDDLAHCYAGAYW